MSAPPVGAERLVAALTHALELVRSGQLAGAEKELRAILAAAPGQPTALHLLGTIALQRGQVDDAIRLVGQAASAQPKSAAIQCDLGFALSLARRFDEAAAHLDAAIALRPEFPEAYLNLGNVERELGHAAAAEAHYRKALEADPKYALAQFNIANLYDERGDYDRALRHYLEAVRLHPGYADAHYNLALLFQGSGQVMEAVRHWKTYLKLDPSSSWAAIARRVLYKLRRYTVVSGRRTGTLERPILE
jgi:Tfp pilus assembly protein PilF